VRFLGPSPGTQPPHIIMRPLARVAAQVESRATMYSTPVNEGMTPGLFVLLLARPRLPNVSNPQEITVPASVRAIA
jgi:hypothetical protein